MFFLLLFRLFSLICKAAQKDSKKKGSRAWKGSIFLVCQDCFGLFSSHSYYILIKFAFCNTLSLLLASPPSFSLSMSDVSESLLIQIRNLNSFLLFWVIYQVSMKKGKKIENYVLRTLFFYLYFCLLFVNNFVLIVDLQLHPSLSLLPKNNCNNLLYFPLNIVLPCMLHFIFMK